MSEDQRPWDKVVDLDDDQEQEFYNHCQDKGLDVDSSEFALSNELDKWMQGSNSDQDPTDDSNDQ